MSTITAPAVRASSRSSTVAGAGFLLGFMLRRERTRLLVSTIGLLAFNVYYVTAISAIYPTAADRQNRAVSIANPGGVYLSGPGYGLEDYTYGAMYANEMALWVMVFLAALNILQITRNTRAEESTGRAELVHSLPLGRHAAAVSSLLVAVISNVVFGLLASVLIATVGGLAVVDSFAMMAGIVVTALVFAGVATVTSQVTVYSRAASGLALAALAAAVLTRGIGDVSERHGSWLSWLSPIAWTQQTRAYVDLRLWPLGLAVVAIVVLLAIGAFFAARRDLGGGLLQDQAGRANAAPSLSSPLALVFRQQRSALVWWLVGCVAMFGLSGAFLGRGASEIATSIAGQNEITSTIFGGNPLGAFLRIFVLHLGFAVAGFAIMVVLRMKPEEDEGRLGLELSRPVSRTKWLLSHVFVATFGMLLLLFVGGGLALWAGSVTSGGEFALGVVLASAGIYAPAIAVLITFTAACYAWFPRATWPAWTLFIIVIVERFFGPLLRLPEAVYGISPFWWVGDYPVTPIEPGHLVGLSVLAVVLLLVALAGFRRRDLSAG